MNKNAWNVHCIPIWTIMSRVLHTTTDYQSNRWKLVSSFGNLWATVSIVSIPMSMIVMMIGMIESELCAGRYQLHRKKRKTRSCWENFIDFNKIKLPVSYWRLLLPTAMPFFRTTMLIRRSHSWHGIQEELWSLPK